MPPQQSTWFYPQALDCIKKIATVGRKRITSARTNRKVASGAVNHYEKSSVVVKGCFVIFTTDKRHFVIPLAFLSNCIFRELFKMSEEEFVLPSDGPITLPCDSVFMNYIISIVKRGLSKDLERAVVNSISTYCFSSDTNFNQGHEDTQSLVFGF
ncbi:auxin-responsive protein SAUR68 [Gossypium hirsutum]|uniref:Auxin-responsive protein SAUR68 n=1 Tax=Gossypium hirsutum TaxID=3635 RepID=A0A1U8JJM3_GOSHI|nr:auxin-responsive protein SAUR68-like [Gossypium hirsutum]